MIYLQSFGQYWVIGIESDSLTDIDLQFNSWYNWCATNGELHWLQREKAPFFAYIYSTEENYRRYLFNVLENRFARKTGYEFEGEKHHKRILAQVEDELSNIPYYQILERHLTEMPVYELGYIEKNHPYQNNIITDRKMYFAMMNAHEHRNQ